MKSSSNKNKKVKLNKGGEEDRISALPDALIHHILSFLEIREVLQTSFISTKWRYLWKSLPVLNFDYSLWNYQSKKKPNARPYVKKAFTQEKCLNFVDRVLLFRDNSSPIQKISFTKYYTCDFLRLSTWLLFAATRHVKEVYIDVYSSPKDLILPDSLFTSGIEVLKLKGKQYTSRQLLGSMCSAHKLRTLDLQFIKLPNDGNLNDKLVFNYPVMENLILEHCDLKHIQNLNIIAPQLKNLVVNCEYDGELDICARNLLSIKLYALSCKKISLGNLSSLVSATLGIRTLTLENECLIQVLEGLRKVTTLQLNGNYEKLSETMHMLEVLNPFSNLKCLKLVRLRDGACIRALGNFLKSVPSIETLVVEVYWDNTMEAELTEVPLQYAFHHLKCVKIIYFGHNENFLKFPTFVLKNAMFLENIAIWFLLKYKQNVLAEFSKELHSLPKASSSVRIDCQSTHFSAI